MIASTSHFIRTMNRSGSLPKVSRKFEQRGTTEADVLTAFDGQALLAAQTALYEELVDFFRCRGRTDRAKAVQTQLTMIEKAVKAQTTLIDRAADQMSDRIEQIDLDEVIDGAMSGKPPESLASIQGP